MHSLRPLRRFHRFSQSPSSRHSRAASSARRRGPACPGTSRTFRDELSPYGQWIETPQGPVWKPAEANAEFTPYTTNGHWEYTDSNVGWVFESEAPYSHVVYHYGNWYQDPVQPMAGCGRRARCEDPLGVDWRFGPSCIGWYPIAPSGVIHRSSPNFALSCAPGMIPLRPLRVRARRRLGGGSPPPTIRPEPVASGRLAHRRAPCRSVLRPSASEATDEHTRDAEEPTIRTKRRSPHRSSGGHVRGSPRR